MLIRTNRHDADWLAKFKRATRLMPEILGAYRMTGDLDYLVRARVADPTCRAMTRSTAASSRWSR